MVIRLRKAWWFATSSWALNIVQLWSAFSYCVLEQDDFQYFHNASSHRGLHGDRRGTTWNQYPGCGKNIFVFFHFFLRLVLSAFLFSTWVDRRALHTVWPYHRSPGAGYTTAVSELTSDLCTPRLVRWLGLPAMWWTRAKSYFFDIFCPHSINI